jgi:hypothetical protein
MSDDLMWWPPDDEEDDDSIPDTEVDDDDDDGGESPLVFPSPLQPLIMQLEQEAVDMFSPVNLIIDPKTRKSAEELRRLILSLPDGFLDVLYRDLYEGRNKRIESAKRDAEKYLASFPKEES